MNLQSQLGIHRPDTQLLLSDEQYPELLNWREVIRQEVAIFIDDTCRFKKSGSTRRPESSRPGQFGRVNIMETSPCENDLTNPALI